MNFGPLEFAEYLRRKDYARAGEPATVVAARAATPAPLPLAAGLTVISAPDPLASCDPAEDSEL
jgi:hypothetical protein